MLFVSINCINPNPTNMTHNKIVPNLWLCDNGGDISAIPDYYKNIFGKQFQPGQVIALGETPSGRTEMCEVRIFGQNYLLMNTAKPHHPLNDAVSLMIYCENQAEIDYYWDGFTREGKESQCGWCIDKFGLRWQVLPQNLPELMSKPNAFQVMMGQKKIVIADYLR